MLLFYHTFSEQLWKKSEDGKLLNKLRCWLSTFCRKNYTSLPEYDAAGFIEFEERGVLTTESGTNVVDFSVKESPITDEQEWYWEKPNDFSGWWHIVNKKTSKYLTAEVGSRFGLLSVKDKGNYLNHGLN